MAASAIEGANSGTLIGATSDGMSTVANGMADVWYSFTSANAGTLRVHSCGSFTLSGVDTALSIHSAVPGSIPNELAANADYPPGAPNLPAACSGAAQSVDALIESPKLLKATVTAPKSETT